MEFITRHKKTKLNHNPVGQYYNANGSGSTTNDQNGWNIFNQIVGYGQMAFSTAGQIGQQIQGTTPISEGEIGDGGGRWEATSGVNTREEKKTFGIPTPLFVGGSIVLGLTTVYLIVAAVKRRAKT